jgi:hypothetical protein
VREDGARLDAVAGVESRLQSYPPEQTEEWVLPVYARLAAPRGRHHRDVRLAVCRLARPPGSAGPGAEGVAPTPLRTLPIGRGEQRHLPSAGEGDLRTLGCRDPRRVRVQSQGEPLLDPCAPTQQADGARTPAARALERPGTQGWPDSVPESGELSVRSQASGVDRPSRCSRRGCAGRDAHRFALAAEHAGLRPTRVPTRREASLPMERAET